MEQPQQDTVLTEQQRKARWSFVYTFVVLPLDGFTFWLMWGFFLAPLGLSAISYWHAIGLSTFGSYILETAFHQEDPDPQRAVKRHLQITAIALVLAIIARLAMR